MWVLLRVTLVMVSLLLLAPLVAIPAQAPPPDGASPPDCKPGLALENDQVRIWFQGKKGFIKVYDTGPQPPDNNTTGDNNTTDGNNTSGGQDNNTTGDNNTTPDWQLVYQYRTLGVREVNGNDTLATLSLNRAFPQTSECTIEETDSEVHVTLNITEDVKGATGGPLGTANVSLAYHFQKDDRGAKFDLIVEDWPWQNNTTSELAFDITLHAGDNMTIEEIPGGVGFRDDEGNERGFISWADNATATYEDGHQEEATVEDQVDGNNTSKADVTLTFTNATAGYTLLEYDPFVGVGRYGPPEKEISILEPIREILDPVIDMLPEPLRSLIRQLLDDLPV